MSAQFVSVLLGRIGVEPALRCLAQSVVLLRRQRFPRLAFELCKCVRFLVRNHELRRDTLKREHSQTAPGQIQLEGRAIRPGEIVAIAAPASGIIDEADTGAAMPAPAPPSAAVVIAYAVKHPPAGISLAAALVADPDELARLHEQAVLVPRFLPG